ncbi:YdiY family protein [Thalassotalea crassostreae]|uniref:DUF481 domain-containing protein n=1 Tax=Thalassotalea crassostreae TaxID=1763536 RepID=UPI0008385C38|nr:DUF481 domain-containing protein [Thalassotalea crassostreae]
MNNNLKLIAVAIAMSPALAFAEEAPAEEEPKLWSGDVDLGYVNLSGNTNETTTSGQIHVVRENAPWKFVAHFETIYSEAEDVKTAEKYDAYTRLEYNYSDNKYVFGRLSYSIDKFSGFDDQYTATAGLGWNLYKEETLDWDVEAGLGYRVANVEDPLIAEDEEESIFRLSTLLKWKFSETAEFVQLLSTEMGADNTISVSESAIKVQVIGAVSFKLAYLVKYTEEVPVGIEHSDKTTLASINYSF